MSQSFLYDDAWFVVYNADVRMRSEQPERLRWRAERVHAALRAAGSTSNYDPAQPWRTVLAMALADKEWRNENLHRPAIHSLTRIKLAATAVEDDTGQPALERSARTAPEQGPGNAHAAHASIPGTPTLDQSIPAQEEHSATSSIP